MILLYPGADAGQAETARTILKSQGIPFQEVTDSDWNTPISELTAGKVQEKGECTLPLFLFYDDLHRDLLLETDQAMKDAGVDTNRKAARTENNVQWPLRVLMDEVGQEARWFALSQELTGYVMNPDRERIKNDPAYLNLMSAAYSLLQDQEAGIADLEAALKAVKEVNK